ncbi:MAG: metal-dependent hydrolase [Rhodospirillaceae bacterium]|nr:metal-dependent hydrolase [Rhodospirillales bacterium]
MMAGSHIIAGAALWAVTAKLTGTPPADPQALGLAALGALLPDIDHPQSWAGRKLKPISVPLAMVVGHRGVTHSLLAVLGGIVVLAVMGMHAWAAPLVIGYLSHLAADGLTPSGVPLLWPMKRRFTLNLCSTGSFVEMGLVAVIALAGGWAAGVDISHVVPAKF